MDCLRSERRPFWVAAGLLMFLAGPLAAADEMLGSPATTAPLQLSSAAASAPLQEPFVSPLGVGKGKIVSKFGPRPTPSDPIKKEPHEGIDLAVLPGDTVKASRSGKVLFVGFSKAYVSRQDKTEQQHLIIIRHADGTSTRYVHLNALRVRPMQDVTAGQPIGTASESDEVMQPVLHFEIRDAVGRALNPEKFLKDVRR